MNYYVYILECCNGTYYTGYTTDMCRRYREHLSGSKKCKYTRSFPPVRLAACWSIDGELSHSLKIEKAIKKLSKSLKINLINIPQAITELIPAAEPASICIAEEVLQQCNSI